MCSINYVCKLFNTCTNIPIKAFDKNYNQLGESGHTKDSLEILKNIHDLQIPIPTEETIKAFGGDY